MDELAEGSENARVRSGIRWTFNFLVQNEGSESLQGMSVTKDYFQAMGLQPIRDEPSSESEGRPGFGCGNHYWLRALAAKVQRGSQHYW